VVVILIDGYHWQELFKGADFDLLKNKKYNPDDSLQRMNKFFRLNMQKRFQLYWGLIKRFRVKKLGKKLRV